MGFPEPSWLAMDRAIRDEVGLPAQVGAYVSHWRLTRRPRKGPYPRATMPWGCDSGTFGANDTGRELVSPQEYVRDVWRFDKEIGMLEWAAPQDRMCESWMLAKNGWTVAGNQRHAIDNFKLLTDLWWGMQDADSAALWDEPGYSTPAEFRHPDLCPFMPVLQGDEADDYRRHVEMYYAAGIRLEDYPVVGLGSVCRRAALKPIQDLVRELAGFLDLHGFGFKIDGVSTLGHLLGSADSMAWSEGTRHEVDDWPCKHGRVKWERNCPIEAMEWAGRVWNRAGEHVDWTDREAFVAAGTPAHEQLCLL